MKMPMVVIIGLLVFIIGFLVIYSRQHGMAPPATPYSLLGTDQPPAAGGYGTAGGYGAPATGGEGKSQ